jgi:hypothetical protein
MLLPSAAATALRLASAVVTTCRAKMGAVGSSAVRERKAR